MRSISQSIAQSVIEPHLMLTLKLNNSNNKLSHVYSSVSRSLQIKELFSKIQANPEAWIANVTIAIDENNNPYFVGPIIYDDTGKYLECCFHQNG